MFVSFEVGTALAWVVTMLLDSRKFWSKGNDHRSCACVLNFFRVGSRGCVPPIWLLSWSREDDRSSTHSVLFSQSGVLCAMWGCEVVRSGECVIRCLTRLRPALHGSGWLSHPCQHVQAIRVHFECQTANGVVTWIMKITQLEREDGFHQVGFVWSRVVTMWSTTQIGCANRLHDLPSKFWSGRLRFSVHGEEVIRFQLLTLAPHWNGLSSRFDRKVGFVHSTPRKFWRNEYDQRWSGSVVEIRTLVREDLCRQVGFCPRCVHWDSLSCEKN